MLSHTLMTTFIYFIIVSLTTAHRYAETDNLADPMTAHWQSDERRWISPILLLSK